jgi:hypothetical protein
MDDTRFRVAIEVNLTVWSMVLVSNQEIARAFLPGLVFCSTLQ